MNDTFAMIYREFFIISLSIFFYFRSVSKENQEYVISYFYRNDSQFVDRDHGFKVIFHGH